MYCSVPLSLSVSTAASAGSELLTLWTPSNTHTQSTHKDIHTQTHTHTHKECDHSRGVWVWCDVSLSVWFRSQAPPASASPRTPPTSSSPLPPSSTPVVTLQLLSQSATSDPNWTAEAGTPTGRFNVAVCLWKVEMEGEVEGKKAAREKTGGGSERETKGWMDFEL